MAPIDNRRQLRLWPGVLAVSVQWLLHFGAPLVMPEAMLVSIGAGVVGGLAVLIWWLFFSRAPWAERIGAVVLIAAAVVAVRPLLDPSISTAGRGVLFVLYVIPAVSLSLVGWAAATRRLAAAVPRVAALVVAIALACGAWTLLRTEGVTGDGRSKFAWRWTETAEQLLVAKEPAPLAPAVRPRPHRCPWRWFRRRRRRLRPRP